MKALRKKKTKPNAEVLLEQEDKGTCQEKKVKKMTDYLSVWIYLEEIHLGLK